MSTKGARVGLAVTTLFWCGWILLSGTSNATLDHQKEAKAAGVNVPNCQFCHVDKLPTKDKHESNERGKWLSAEKEKRHAAKVDGAWIKDYPGDKK
jgi:hypothetical protein